MLYCIEEIKLKYPDLNAKEYFYHTIASRPGINTTLAINTIKEAFILEEGSPVKGNILRYVCYLMCRFDHKLRLKRGKIPEKYMETIIKEIWKNVL